MSSPEAPRFPEDIFDGEFVNLNHPWFDEQFSGNGELFSKTAKVFARQVQEGETQEAVTTILLGGTLEANRLHPGALPGSWIVVNPMGERFLVDPVKFDMRYELVDPKIGLYRGIGLNLMIQNPFGRPVKIRPPWDEDDVMEGDENCWFSMVVHPDNPRELTSDRYIIGNAEKRLTFNPAGAGYQEVDLQSQWITDYLRENGVVMKKKGLVFGYKLRANETRDVVHNVPDLGKIILTLYPETDETLIIPSDGRPPYLIADTTLGTRYKEREDIGLYEAQGAIITAPYPTPTTAVKALASWGQMQHIPRSAQVVAAINEVEAFNRADIPDDRYLLEDLGGYRVAA